MIILDQTIVNVALPSIQARPRASTQSGLAWVVNALPDRVRRAAAARRPARRPARPPRGVHGRPGRLHASPRCCAGWRSSQAMLIAARFVQGVGGALELRRDPRHDRDDVPAAGRAGEGDRRSTRFVASAGASIGLLLRRRADAGAGLALDLLRQRPDRRRDARARALRLVAPEPRPRADARAPTCPGAVLVTGALMLGVYAIVGAATTAGVGSDAGPRRARWRCWPAFVCARGDRRDAAAAAARSCARATWRARTLVQTLLVAGRARHVLPRRALPAARARLRRAGDRRRVPAGLARRSARCRWASRRG